MSNLCQCFGHKKNDILKISFETLTEAKQLDILILHFKYLEGLYDTGYKHFHPE